jgi:RNA polymerase sigma factor (sigma-70 family)
MGAETLTAVLTDHALLDRFVRDADGEAFAELVRRHGPMVRATCARLLGPTPDADDAFQAAFLVLVRRAGSVSRRDLLGPWLHTVALRAARKALALRQRRHSRERPVTHMPEPTLEPTEPRDWLPLLDDAVQALPEKYRLPLVLCELQGVSRAEAAERLALAEGTLSSRLARGRDLLRRRLVRRGVSVSAVALAAGLASQASASVAPGLVASTTQAVLSGQLSAPVAAITQGVLHAMVIAKLKLIAVVVLGLSVSLAGSGALAWHLAAQGPEGGAVQPPPNNLEKEKQALQGEWKVVSVKMAGAAIDPNEEAQIKDKGFVFKGDKVTAKGECDYHIRPAVLPHEIDVIPREGPENEKDQTFRGIYEINGDELKLTVGFPNQPRPKAFDEEGAMAFVLKREKGKK